MLTRPGRSKKVNNPDKQCWKTVIMDKGKAEVLRCFGFFFDSIVTSEGWDAIQGNLDKLKKYG